MHKGAILFGRFSGTLRRFWEELGTALAVSSSLPWLAEGDPLPVILLFALALVRAFCWPAN